jgi:hypothetical protein
MKQDNEGGNSQKDHDFDGDDDSYEDAYLSTYNWMQRVSKGDNQVKNSPQDDDSYEDAYFDSYNVSTSWEADVSPGDYTNVEKPTFKSESRIPSVLRDPHFRAFSHSP